MTLTQLKYAVEISKTKSINHAAQNLFVSQSVLSVSLKNLESELGEPIFFRSAHGITITPFGRTFLNYAAPLVAQFDQLNMVLHTKPDNIPIQKLSLVSNGLAIADICSRIYDRYAASGIRIFEYEAFEMEALMMVNNGIAEFALLRLWSAYESLYLKQLESLDLSCEVMSSLDIGISVGPRNPLYYQSEPFISPSALNPYPAVVYDYMYSGPFSNIFDLLNLPVGKNMIITTSRATLYETLNQTEAYYLNSCYDWGNNNRYAISNYRTLKLQGTAVKSNICLVTRKDMVHAPLVEEAIDIVKEIFQVS